MFSIGVFSSINKITTKTLRHYDEIGLLKPEYVDDFTGYRYYSSNQLPRLYKIRTLKQMGLSLCEIKEVIDNPISINMYLKLKEQEIQTNIDLEKTKLLQIQNYIKGMKGELDMPYNAIIKELPEVIVASMRRVVPDHGAYFTIYPEMGEYMHEQKVTCAVPEYCFTIYHDGEYKDKDIDIEICEAVTDYAQDSEDVKFKKMDRVPTAVCTLHKGPYTTFNLAYGFIFKWIEDNGYKAIGMPRESYIDGVWNKEDQNEWLTEIQVPVSKI
ncbi:MerR family transcriptional regulator [Vallitalea okinawensis]|uniref:MerR family transcriptional regulator n=1 Tax=Vallitalea okinawensis TaxID=2078660 RepID=UPI000CFD5BB1|nr:MerR family transcriptional regulator [Vallitalea okinawensis]